MTIFFQNRQNNFSIARIIIQVQKNAGKSKNITQSIDIASAISHNSIVEKCRIAHFYHTSENLTERKAQKNKKISATTIKRYIDYLEDSFLTDSAIRCDIKGKKYINTPSKYYFSDLGLRNARLNFRQVEETHAMENIIFNELKTRGYNTDVGVVALSETNKTGKQSAKQSGKYGRKADKPGKCDTSIWQKKKKKKTLKNNKKQ